MATKPPATSLRTSIFRKLVRDCTRDALVSVSPETPLADVIALMAAEGATSATVTDAEGRPIGILTEQDVTRRVVFRAGADQPVQDVMTPNVVTIAAGDYLYHAIARMRRLDLRHLPVVDERGALAGILDLPVAIADTSAKLMDEIDTLTREDSIDGLAEVKAAQVNLADHMLRENLAATEIQGLLTHINNDVYRRVVNLTLAGMESDGLGPPPREFSVIVMGSGGRGENFVYPDQDNGIIIEDYPDDSHTEIDAWFVELAERMTRDLDRVGFPLCKGAVMATNPLWRKTQTQWKDQVTMWSRRRNTTALRLCDIFFDFRSVWGEAGMARDLRQHVTRVAGGNVAFLRDMYEDGRDHAVALGWFGRFVTERNEVEHKGQINLKHTGTLPLIEAIRLLALREAVDEVSTLGRIQALHDSGVLGRDEYDYLGGSFRHICRLLLRQQVSDFIAGNRVSNYVKPGSLTKRERNMLVDSFKAIRALRDRVRSDFTGNIF